MNKSLKEIRLELGLRQEDLAKDLGITQGYLSKLEQGWLQPKEDTLIKLYQIYEVSIDAYLDNRIIEKEI